MTLVAAADGSSLANPGPSGWAWYIDDDRWHAGGWPHGTNNMGELMAVLDLLRQTAEVDDELLILCDSQYVINSVTKWMAGWKRNGWVKKDKKPVLNVELLKELDAALEGRRVRFEWVKGHAGHELNEAADNRARAAATAYRDRTEVLEGPGFAPADGLASSTRSARSKSVRPEERPLSDAPSAESKGRASSTRSARSESVKKAARSESATPEERFLSDAPEERPLSEAPSAESKGRDSSTRSARSESVKKAARSESVAERQSERSLSEAPEERPLSEAHSAESKGPDPSDVDTIVALERALLSDEVRSSRQRSAELLHPDFCEIGSSGRVWTRDAMLDSIAPLPSPVELEVLDCSPIADNTVLLLWRASGRGWTVNRSSVWLRTDDGWRLRFHQGTRA